MKTINNQWIVEKYSDWFTIKPGVLIKTTTDKNMSDIFLALYYYQTDNIMLIKELDDVWYYPPVGNRLPDVDPAVNSHTLMFIEVVTNFSEDFSRYSDVKDWRALKFLSGKHIVGLLVPNLTEEGGNISCYPYRFDVL